jgi:hypothetical protein
MSISQKTRLIIGVSAACVVLVVSLVARQGYSYSVMQPTASLDEMPRNIGEWWSEPAELTEAEFGVLNATDVASLRFKDPIGRVAFLHIATWTDPDEIAETCPHHPNVCYTGNGWFPVETRRLELNVEDVGDVPIEISLMDRNGERLVLAFSYVMGTHRFATDTDARIIQTQYWGQSIWPPVTKYMLQVTADDIDTALPQIQEVLGTAMRWHNQQDKTQRAANATN